MFEKIGKIVFIFIFFIFMLGCSQKYVARTDRELLDRKVFALWDDLDGRIVGRSEESFCLNLIVLEFIEVRDSLEIKEFYKRGFKNKDGEIEQSSSHGFARVLLGGGLMGCSMYLGAGLAWASGFAGSSRSSCITWGSWGVLAGCLLGAAVSIDGVTEIGYKSMKVLPPFAKVDTVCVDSLFLIKQKIKISIVELDFEKEYYTDRKGNVGLRFDEILLEPTEADSILNLIIQYEEMVDTVDVKIK